MEKVFSTKKNIAGLIIAFVLLYFALRNINFHEVLVKIRNINTSFLSLSIILSFSGFFVRIFRTQFFLKLQDLKARLWDVTYVNTLTSFFDRLTPSKIGEVYRILSHKRFNASKSGMVPLIYVSKLLDLITLLLFTVFVSFLVSIQSEMLTKAIIVFSAMIMSLLTIIFLFFNKKGFLKRFFKLPILNRFEERVEGIFNRVEKGFRSYSYKSICLGLLLGLLFWISKAVSFYFIALGFNLEIGFWFVSLLYGASVLLGLIPLSPGGLGLKELFLINSFSVQIQRSLAASITLINRIFIAYLVFFIFTGLVVVLDKSIFYRGKINKS